MLKQRLFAAYLAFGLAVTSVFGMAAAAGLKLPKAAPSSHFHSSGRSYGGSWGGGK